MAGLLVASLLVRLWARAPDDTPALILAPLAAWAAYRQREEWKSRPRQPSAWGLLFVAAGAALFPLAWYLRITFGPRQAVLFLLGAAVLASAAGLLLLEHGRLRLATLAFPLALAALCLPLPGTLMSSLQVGLKDLVTSASRALLEQLGVEAAREGFVLRVPSGRLLVSEACSGLRSLLGLVSLAFVVAFLRPLGLGAALGLALLAVLVSIPANVVRITSTALLAERSGVPAALSAHVALGHVVILVGFALLFAAARFLPPRRPASERAPGPPSPARRTLRLPVRAALACLALAALATAGLHRLPVEVPPPELTRLPLQIEGFRGEDAPLRSEWSALGHDRILHRVYADAAGREMDVVVAFWGDELQAGPHDADVCWSAQGWVFESGATRPLLPRAEAPPVEVAFRRYRRPEGTWTYAFWTQQGRVVLDPKPGFLEHRNVRRVLASPVNASARLFVRVGSSADPDDPRTEALVQTFAAQVLSALYDICPWAAPAGDRGRSPSS
jgi:exosortase